MTTITAVGVGIMAIAIYLDKLTLFRHDALPATVFAGLMAIIASLVL